MYQPSRIAPPFEIFSLDVYTLATVSYLCNSFVLLLPVYINCDLRAPLFSLPICAFMSVIITPHSSFIIFHQNNTYHIVSWFIYLVNELVSKTQIYTACKTVLVIYKNIIFAEKKRNEWLRHILFLTSGLQLIWDQMILSQVSPNNTRKHRYLHHDS